MSQIFISYSREETEFVQQLALNLEIVGFKVWRDVSDLKGGDVWVRTVQTALKESPYFVLVLSPSSVKSEWVEKEYIYAISLGSKIIPILYETCEMPMALVNIHYVDFWKNSYERGFQELLVALEIGNIKHNMTSCHSFKKLKDFWLYIIKNDS